MKACFIGLGYIGLPTAVIAARIGGVETVGVDINKTIVDRTNAGELHFVEPGMQEMLSAAVSEGKLRASMVPEEADAFFVVVPTPFKGDHLPDVSHVEAATRAVAPFLCEGNLFIIESTSPVGTTEAMADVIYGMRPELRGKIHVAYCPERVLPGNVIYELVHNDRVIGGMDDASTEAARNFYSLFVKGTLHSTNARTAEMCKLTENASRDVQIAFANELSLICDKAGIDVWELIELANRHPRVNILRPGCGVGGHCIAVDPYFLTADFPEQTKVIATAREVNNHKALWCAERIKNAVLEFKLSNKRPPVVALMGLAFKPNIDDMRESPAKMIAGLVLSQVAGAEVLVSEPHVSHCEGMELSEYRHAYGRADIVVFLTAHDVFRSLPEPECKTILDFCGIYNKA